MLLATSGATIDVLHVLPEDGTIERFGLTNPSCTTFRHRGAYERSREQIGTVTLHVGDGETARSFLADVDTRIRRLQTDRVRSVEVTQSVQEILRPRFWRRFTKERGEWALWMLRRHTLFILFTLSTRTPE